MLSVPKSKRKRALIFVDIQRRFLKGCKRPLLTNLKKLCKQEVYDLYVEVTFHAEKGSLWDKQTHWTFPYEPSVKEIKALVAGKPIVSIIKETSSAFKGKPNLASILKQKGIEEIHVVGLDTNDCIFATAQEAFDLGFYTYVIEECTGSSSGEKMHKNAIEILRHLELTNHIK